MAVVMLLLDFVPFQRDETLLTANTKAHTHHHQISILSKVFYDKDERTLTEDLLQKMKEAF